MFDISPNHIVVGNGAAELISIMTNSLDLKFGLYGPTFDEYTSRFENIDLKISDNDGFAYVEKDIQDLAKSNDGFILINPDNPTGNFINYD